MKELVSRSTIVSAALLFTQPAIAQNNTAPPVASSSISETTSLDRYEKLLEKLTTERQSLTDESKRQFEIIKYVFERERDSFQSLLERTLWIAGVLFAGTTSVISFFFYRIYGEQKSLREKFLQETKEEVAKLEKESKEMHAGLLQELAQLERLKEEARSKQKEIASFINEQNKFKEKNICWLYGQQGISDASIILSLKQKGIDNVHEANLMPDSSWTGQHYDVIVFSIGASENIGNNLSSVLSKLKSQGEPPVVVYTYNQGKQIKLSKDEWDVLDRYDNYTVANFPGSLQTTLNNILRWL